MEALSALIFTAGFATPAPLSGRPEFAWGPLTVGARDVHPPPLSLHSRSAVRRSETRHLPPQRRDFAVVPGRWQLDRRKHGPLGLLLYMEAEMRRHLAGLALALSVFAFGSGPASAGGWCWDCDYGHGPYYYGAPAYYGYGGGYYGYGGPVYYVAPRYYAPPVYTYYAPPSYRYYAPTTYEYTWNRAYGYRPRDWGRRRW
jgi:hypothetical protein